MSWSNSPKPRRRSKIRNRIEHDLGLNKKKGGYVSSAWLHGQSSNVWYPRFNFNPRTFEPSKHRKAFLTLLMIGLAVFVGTWAQDKTNPLFHSQSSSVVSLPDPDVVTPLFTANGAGGTLAEFNTNAFSSTAGVTGPSSGTLWAGSKALTLNANTTSNGYAVAIATNGFDPSAVSGKHLKTIFFFKQISGQLNNGQRLTFFFTRNNTAPKTPTWNALTDKNVAFAYTFYDAGGDGLGFDWSSNVMIQLDPTVTISSEDTGSCGGAGSCYMMGTILYSNAAYAPTTLTQDSLWLNFTGNSGNSGTPASSGSCAASGVFAQGGQGCSVGIVTPSNTIRADTGFASFNLPRLIFQGQTYYAGIELEGHSVSTVALDVGLDTGLANAPNQVDPTGSQTNAHSFQVGVAQIISIPVPVSPTIDTGGWFGPIIRALIAIGVFILNAILAFVGFITPAIQAALGVLENVMVAMLNFLGNIFGFGNVGSNLQQLINSAVTFMTGSAGTAFNSLGAIFSRVIDTFTVAFDWITTQLNIASDFMGWAVGMGVFVVGLFTLGMKLFTGLGVLFLFFYFFVADSSEGVDGWVRTFETFKYVVFDMAVKWVTIAINFALDIVTALVGTIPKPFVQMVAHQMPRIPNLEIHGSLSTPRFDGQSLREGNLFAIIGLVFGFVGLIFYESQPLIGSFALLPGTVFSASAVTNLSVAVTFYKLFLPSIVLIAFLLMIPTVFKRVFMIDVGIAGVPVSFSGPSGPAPNLGRRGGPLLSRNRKHLQSRLERKLEERGKIRGSENPPAPRFVTMANPVPGEKSQAIQSRFTARKIPMLKERDEE